MVNLARIGLLWLAWALLLAFAPMPAQAGTEEAPEIVDAADDQEIAATVPACPAVQCAAAQRIDAVAVWIDNETATTFNVNIKTTSAPGGATAATSTYEFHAMYAGTEVVSIATATGGATIAAPAPTQNVESVAVEGNVLVMTIPKAAYGAPVAGEALSGLFYRGVSSLPSPTPDLPVDFATDRAPDSGAGTDYVLTGGAGGTPGDADGDGLNDTREQQQFGSTAAQNGTGDPDADGLNNTREFALGTNASKADTDGDGVRDGDDPFPLDATRPAGAAADTDGDGLNDTWEREHFNGTVQTGSGDPDQDGLNNTAELAAGTDPTDADTDGDGREDGVDALPLVPAGTSDGDAGSGREAKPELYAGSLLFAVAATFILLGLAKGL